MGEIVTVVRVNPDSIREYARLARSQFELIRTALQFVTADVVGVRYLGPNAYNFKVQTGEMAAQFSLGLLGEIQLIAQAVSQATSNTSSALGGEVVAISVDGTPLPVPAVEPGGEVVDVDTSALDALKPRLAASFTSIGDMLQKHLERFQATDWQGQAKAGAIDAVSEFTRRAQVRAQDSHRSLEGAIDQQIAAVLSADRRAKPSTSVPPAALLARSGSGVATAERLQMANSGDAA
jgi:hypothetical protein